MDRRTAFKFHGLRDNLRVSGRADFYHTADPLPSSSALSRSFMQSSGLDVQATPVEVITLDEFLPANGIDHVDLVKIDTESTEPDVVAGMMRTVERDSPDIIAEVLDGWGTLEALRGMLRPLGYEDVELTELRLDAVGERTGVNTLFTRRGSEIVRDLVRPF